MFPAKNKCHLSARASASHTDSHQAQGGGEVPWSPFFHEQRCYRARQQWYGVLSGRGLSLSLILSSYPTSLAQSPSPYQPQRWVCGSKALIFCARANRDCFGGGVLLITPGIRGSLNWGETDISPEPFPANGAPLPFLGKAGHGCLSHMLQSIPLANKF